MVDAPRFKWFQFYDDLMGKTENILIAGMPGAGKSVILNGIINSILLKSAKNNSMILIDLKRVELGRYKNTPNCMAFASTQQEAEILLRRVLKFVEDRYAVMEQRGEVLYSGTKVHLIIDEMAQLMLRSKVAKNLIQQIVQISRAANVQVICATQSPKATVIPTEITCDFGLIIGLHTRNAQDSRNILGENGCESLPKYGKALIQYADEAEVVPTNIPFIEYEEINKLIQWRLAGN